MPKEVAAYFSLAVIGMTLLPLLCILGLHQAFPEGPPAALGRRIVIIAVSLCGFVGFGLATLLHAPVCDWFENRGWRGEDNLPRSAVLTLYGVWLAVILLVGLVNVLLVADFLPD